jgi:hypothetical protein
MASVQQMIETDVSVLLLRALNNKTLVAFGDDGLGKYGTCDMPQYYAVHDLDISVDINEADDTAAGVVYIELAGYDAARFGAITTDRNFLLSVQEQLESVGIDRSVLTYAPDGNHLEYGVLMSIDIKKLLDWP